MSWRKYYRKPIRGLELLYARRLYQRQRLLNYVKSRSVRPSVYLQNRVFGSYPPKSQVIYRITAKGSRPDRTLGRRDVYGITKIGYEGKYKERYARGGAIHATKPSYTRDRKILPPKYTEAVYDKRYWYPGKDNVLLTKGGAEASKQGFTKALYMAKALPRSVRYYAENPARLWECIKRRMRKEVIHAVGKAGKAGIGQKRPIWKRESYIIC